MSNIMKRLDELCEGSSKRALEDKVEKACTCGGGISLDIDEHDKECPARKIIEEYL